MRSLPSWIGKNDDQKIPPRVKLRIWDRFNGRCGYCDKKILTGERWEIDHIVSLINSGRHAEDNLQLICGPCHKVKTGVDVKEKSAIYNKRIIRMGFKTKRKIPGSKGSGIRMKMDGTIWKE